MKRVICILLAFSMLLTGCEATAEKEELTTETIAETEVIVEEEPQLSIYEEDAQYLIQQVEDIHPCFVLDDVPENYEEVKATYLETVKTIEDTSQFTVESLRYLSVLGDGHTNLGISGICNKILDLNSIYYNGVQWLEDENGLMTDTKIISIDGVEPAKIWTVIEELFPFENESAYVFYKYHAMFDAILQLAGIDVAQNEVEVIFEKNGEQYSEKRMLLTLQDFIAAHPDCLFASRKTADYEMLNDVFYLDLNQFKIDDSLNASITALKESITNGTKKVIVDLRGNSGGNSLAGTQILAAMGMKEPAYSWHTRNKGSSLVNAYEPLVENMGAANPNISLIVLSDEISFSAATMFCVWTQDGHLGKVIGQPSSNSPNCYGDVARGKLPNTKIQYQISFKYWMRPDQEADPDRMEMDVYVSHDTDALDVALEMLAE